MVPIFLFDASLVFPLWILMSYTAYH